ncbi:gp53-like domain-containing protein [Jiulongibacter sediminis]|uniref:Putative tail fiber protein gp53-like C-terminal domain-containing protein n=1 Tax=Jiulongibacter sediminis TaxID=1605367 RepID=A0A0P7BMK5_9BACT|nr:hypothetical protein [Jiulongibacter sediminis]KPM46552.1 hypothetical protein AFM12_19370 [Jiulongibacter sediminis]TBX20742.1 hypothetical protein TK44_19375 [Jiulongibacter sediminis]
MQKLIILLLFVGVYCRAQSVLIDPSNPSALVEMNSKTSGWEVPRITTEQRNQMVNPVEGLMIINADNDCLNIYNGSNWIINCGYTEVAAGEYRSVLRPSDDREFNTLAWRVSHDTLSSINSGNVGVDNEYPTAKLDVGGTLKANAWLDQMHGQNGYARMAGVLVQWGEASYTNNTYQVITFPSVFTQTPVVNAVVDAVSNTGSGANVPVKIGQLTNSSFSIGGTQVFSNDTQSKVRWIAIGI